MSIFREIPPTAGWPLYFKEILSGFQPFGRALEDDFKKYLNVNYAKITYSGTAAFYLILESLKSLSRKKTVIIPAFICPLLALAIKRAGLRVEVCDIEENSFNFNYDELEKICAVSDDILAIVPAYLGGLPLEFEKLERIAKARGIFIVEDCAQSLGAEYKGKKIGTMGDFAFFSLCRGKGLTIYEGGVIVTNKAEHASVIEQSIEQLVKKDLILEALKILESFGYWIFYRPALFWFIFRLPQIFWQLQGNQFRANIEYFEIDFPIHEVSGMRISVGHAGFPRMENEIIKQRQKAQSYLNALGGIGGVKAIREPSGSKASYPYVSLIFRETQQKVKAMKKFADSGLGVSQIYAIPITGYDYLKGIVPERNFPNAEYLAARHITLSTSTFLRDDEMSSIVDIIKEL